MTKFTLVLVVAFSVRGWSGSMAQPNTPTVAAAFPGSWLKWIHAAEPDFQRKHLNLDDYKISVAEGDSSVVVVLRSSDAPPGGLGSMGTHPGYEVEVSKRDLQVIRSNYVR
jgi:hypothetical protein